VVPYRGPPPSLMNIAGLLERPARFRKCVSNLLGKSVGFRVALCGGIAHPTLLPQARNGGICMDWGYLWRWTDDRS
jgi:hypothetical protein